MGCADGELETSASDPLTGRCFGVTLGPREDPAMRFLSGLLVILLLLGASTPTWAGDTSLDEEAKEVYA